ncbi:hypothetical protein CPB84DRAFT_1812420 [Gymnopilus junonius]|uniref:Sld7 C-terminal domain-containing protein n=1 Tax=Gymnopilus junonius TaxID=109634 RepID=A0A9P5NZN7_GYMJU|nr:hypothetical protein CPB84DRAFT_1812420 [Gymnopilus junonius]
MSAAAVGAPSTPPCHSATNAPSYRLLYRGALSLPDSLLLLDGLTFTARLGSPSKQSSFQLLENPLALALESMRGRPTLRFIGSVNLKDIYVDESGGVEMDIHPSAILSQIYFENTFCLLPFASASASTSKDSKAERSEIGIRVALGIATTHIVIYAQLVPWSESHSEDRRTIRLCVGRITQRPVSPQTQKKRVPRPDDPIPRKPPALGGVTTGSGAGRELKRVASGTSVLGVGVAPAKRQKVTNGNGIAADLGSGVRLGVPGDREHAGDGVFKVPELPKNVKAKGKGKEKEREKEKDVFGDVSPVERVHAGNKGKQKADESQDEGAALEKTNKNLIKRATIEYLGRTKDPTDPTRVIDKSHSEFKDLYGFIYRGVGFALRAKMRTCAVDSGLVNHLIGMHALMYLGHGG